MKQNFLASVRQYSQSAASFISCIVFLRLYEMISIAPKITSDEFFLFELVGLLNDLRLGLIIILMLGISGIVVGVYKPVISNWFAKIGFTAYVITSFCLIEYYTITLVPLSSDLFGYSASDVILTAESSGGISLKFFVFIFLFVGLLTCIDWILRKRELFYAFSVKSFSPIIACALVLIVIGPFNAETDTQDLSVSKPERFLSKSISYFVSRGGIHEYESNGFPFMHEANYASPLAEYLKPTEAYPNIVFILVEGLGRDFVGSGAKWAGFTPFLDSLSLRSLYWENMLSNSGRTFGVLPSILAGLPYGNAGVLSYGARMPNHQSLITLLKPLGYKTNFFHGGNSNFDNQDLFLETNGIDLLIDESKFPISYEKMKSGESGFSWGYGDRDVFNYSLEQLKINQHQGPRMDIYLTLSTHEPFRVPEDRFVSEFDNRLNQLEPEPGKRKMYVNNRKVFECLSYTDDALREFFAKYKERKDYDNTIFIITGDHRLIPIEQDSRIDRFHVPLLIFSPMLKKAERFSSVNVHASVTPTLLGWYSESYKTSFPKEMPFIAGPLSFNTNFSCDLDLALIRNKNETIDYIYGTSFLSNDRVYQIQPNLTLKPIEDIDLREKLHNKLVEFNQKGIFALENNRLDKSSYDAGISSFHFTNSQKQFIKENNLRGDTPDKLFERARNLASESKYSEGRVILKYLLNRSPNYHDARIFLARTFGWESQYDSARKYLKQTKLRVTNSIELYSACADVEYWASEPTQSLAFTNEGLKYDSLNAELLSRKARIFFLNGDAKTAEDLINLALKADPSNEIANELLEKLKLKNEQY